MIKMFFIYDCFVSSKLDSKPNSVAKSCYNFSLDTITPYVGRDPEKPGIVDDVLIAASNS